MFDKLVYTEFVDDPHNSCHAYLQLGGLPDATYTICVGITYFVINRKVVKN